MTDLARSLVILLAVAAAAFYIGVRVSQDRYGCDQVGGMSAATLTTDSGVYRICR